MTIAAPPLVSNRRLIASRIPRAGAPIDEIDRFARTFSAEKAGLDIETIAAIGNAQRHSTLTEIRICLYFEQRKWKWSMYPPTADEEAYARSLVEMIRQRVTLANELLR